jgi:hypothetical protein
MFERLTMEQPTTLIISFADFKKSELPLIMEEVTSCLMFGFESFEINIEKEHKGSFELVRNTLPEFKADKPKPITRIENGIMYIKSKL